MSPLDLRFLVVPALLLQACGPRVSEDEHTAGSEAVIDAETFAARDHVAYQELVDRCGCEAELFGLDGYRLAFLDLDLEILDLRVDSACAEARLAALEAPGCGLEDDLDCEVYRGAAELGEPCTQGIYLDDCSPGLFCLTEPDGAPSEGQCVLQAELGESCESHMSSCREGACLEGRCTAEASAVGDACWLSCADGLLCEAGSCREPTRCDPIPVGRY